MKKIIGAAIANWFRKPENREKAKRAARQAYSKYQQRKHGSSLDDDIKRR